VRAGVRGAESVSDHSWGVAVAALCLPRRVREGGVDVAIDVDRCVRIALVHDLAEAVVGDLTPDDVAALGAGGAAEKRRRERDALLGMVAALASSGGPATAVQEAYDEYEAGATLEAKLVKDLDKLEMLVTARLYEAECATLRLGGFFDGTRGRWRTETVAGWAAELLDERSAALAGVGASSRAGSAVVASASAPAAAAGATMAGARVWAWAVPAVAAAAVLVGVGFALGTRSARWRR